MSQFRHSMQPEQAFPPFHSLRTTTIPSISQFNFGCPYQWIKKLSADLYMYCPRSYAKGKHKGPLVCKN